MSAKAIYNHPVFGAFTPETRQTIATPVTKSQRITIALLSNNLTWESPIVDLIDALVYDGDFTCEEADEIACRSAR